MHRRWARAFARRRAAYALAWAVGTLVAASAISPAAATAGTRADAVALERARGNDRLEAARIGRKLFETIWPVQVTKIRVDVAGTHRVAGLVLSGAKFHEPVTPETMSDEVARLVNETFDASSVEEVDLWVTLPLPTYANEVVAGDLARPTFYIVYATTVRRSERATFAERVRRGEDVYWLPKWRATLTGR